MVLPQPNEKGHSAVSLKSNLTQALTTIVTQARMKSLRMREEPELPKNNSVSLLVTDGASKGMSFPVQKPQVVIGRTTGDILIADSKISSLHCVVEVHGPSALLVDLESGNGTFVSGKKVVSSELDHLSEFRVGKTTLMFVITGRY